MNRYAPPLSERFWSRVSFVAPGGCWLWTGGLNGRTGYGVISSGHRPLLVHRLSWTLEHGPIPKGQQVCHHCDVKLCVRPSHLFFGTQADNMRDKVEKGRAATGDRNGKRTHPEKVERGADHWTRRHPDRIARGERTGGSKLDADKVRDIRRLRVEGWTLEQIATEYGVAIGTIHFIVTRKTWAHVE